MSTAQPLMVDQLDQSCTDGAFIAFASPEERSLGAARRIDGYRTGAVCILEIEDEENAHREINRRELERLASKAGPVSVVKVRHDDPIRGIDRVAKIVSEACGSSEGVTVDISTFPKNALLLTLRAIERLRNVRAVRILYTEPGSYDHWLEEPLSFGLRRVGVVPTFAGLYRGNRDLVLVMFLGFERDRTLGLWQSIEPHRTIAVIGEPPYHPEWRGIAERLNAALLAGLDEDDIIYSDPRDPVAAYDVLRRVIVPGSTPNPNFYIAPLGTKPQTVGVHYFCQEFPAAATVAYASPLELNTEYTSEGVGPTWLLPKPGGHK